MHQSIPRALIVVSLLCTVGWSSPARAQAWFDTSWVFRSPITVTNSNGSTLTNFQVSVTLDSTFNFAGAKTDGSDLRVTAANGTTPLSFWVEKWNATTHQAKVWVKIPSLPAGNTTIFLYYGMPTATSTANGKNTFELFDDFTATASPGYYNLGPPSTIMTQDTPWEHEAPHTLSVVPAPTGAPYTYYGYYGLQGCSGIGIAGTNDLLNWVKFPTNPLFTGGGERWPHVLKNGSTYFMVHTVNFCGTPNIVYRTSTNGTTWSGPTQMVAPQAGKRNQNPNLFQDPKTGLFHLYWYRGDDATLWTIMGRTSSTLSGLASASDQVLISSNKTLAAPNMMYRDSTYFLSTEISETVWKTVIFSGPSPTGPFTKLPGNPVMGDGAACLFQLSIGSSIYQYYCKETAAVWTLDMRVSDTTLGRQQIGKIDSTQWAPDGGDWHALVTAQPNGTQGMVAQGSTNAEQILKSNYSATNYVLESSGRLIEGRTWGIGARGANADDGYRLNLYDDLDGGQNLFLYRWDNGDATELWSKAVGTINKNTWYKLGLRVSGTQISVYFNDVLQTPTPVNDPNLDLGPVQLAGEESSLAQFDDVHVRKHAAAEPASVRGAEEVLGNSRPVALIGAPANNSFYFGSGSIALTSSSMDAQTPPESLLYKWTVSRQHAADPPTITTFTTRNASFVPNHGADSAVVFYNIKLKVTDAGGLSDSTSINIYPEIDLAPSAIGVAPAAPTILDSLTLSVVLHNNGRVHTPLSHWYLRDGNTVLAQGDVALAALDSTTIVRKIGPRTLGMHVLRFTADSLLAVVETSEANNASTRSQNITNPPGMNQPPVANAAAAPSTGAAPLTVNFSSAGSSDPDADSLSFAWNFGNGGSSTQANPTYVYTGSGVFAAILNVTDGRGGSASDTVIVTVGVASGFPTTAVLDNFNRVNGPIGGSWIDPVHNLVGLMIDSNALVQLCCSYASPVWNGAVFGANQEAYITLSAVTANAPEHDLMLKLQGNGDTSAHIEVRFDKPLGQVAVGTYDPAVGWAAPAPPIPADFVAGDQLGARAKSDGIVEVYKNGLLIGTVDCSGWAYATLGGRIGMTLDQAYSSRLDNFGGGNVVAYVPPTIATASPLPNGQTDSAYSQTVTGTGGTTPYAWAVTVGSLPAGLTLNPSSGAITGTPTGHGTSNFTIRLTDAASVAVTKAFALTVNPAALVITSTSPRPNAQVGVAYTDTVKATGGVTPYAWAVTVGALPAGLTLNASSGAITGTPTSYGTSNFTIRVTDSLSVQTTKAFALTVNPAALVITTASPLPNAQVGAAYAQTVTGTGGATPYAWAVTVGALPAGLTLNASSGAITGTPTAYGTSNFTIRLTDSLSVQTTKAFALTVNPAALVITSTSPRPNAQVGVAYTDTVKATGGVTPYAWAVTVGALPAGLTLNTSNGAITGTTTTYGTSSFTIRVTDSLSVQTTKAFALTVNPAALVITTTSPLPSGQVGAAYAQTLTGTGGATPYAWAVTVGSLPAGLTLNASSGAITGTPTAYGTSNFTIRLTDSLSVQTTKAFALTVNPAALVITSTSPRPNAQVGIAYTDTVKASGGATPYSWAVTVGTLPAGLTLNASSGAITGTPTAYGTSNFTIRVTDSLSVQTTKAFALTVNPAALVITTASPLASGQVGVAYSQTLAGTGGATPYSWAVSIGSLPAGLTLNASSGAITGTPTAYGTSNFTIQLTDSLSVQTTKAFELTVNPAALVITTASPLASGQVGVAYSQTLAGTGGATPYSWAVSIGSLPAGLTLNASSGAITGTPTAYGTSNFTIQLTDSLSVQTTKAFELTVSPATLVITTASPLPSGQVGTAYSQTLAGTGGATPYSWAVSVGSLPAGLTLNASSGAITGTPTAYGTSNFTIQLTDSLSVQTTKAFALTVNPAALVIATASPLPGGQVDVAYSQALAGTGGATPYNWAVSIGTLPAGLTLNASSGAITGTPTAYGTSNFTIQLTDSLSVQTTKAFALTVNPAALVIATASPLPGGQVDVAYSQALAGTGGATPYSWAVSIGSLPAGLTLNASSGAITGTPTAYGTSNFTIQLTDSLSVQTTKAFALTVNPAALVIATASPLPGGQVDVAYSQALAGTGGATPYNWAVSIGTLPAGLTLNASSGAITGTPTVHGTSNFTIQLTDSLSVQTTKAFALTVSPATLVITTASLPSGQVGAAYSQALAGTGGATPYNWAVSIGTLPAGLTLNASSGAITGTPTAYGKSTFTIQLTDSASVVTTKEFALTVNPATLVITSTTPLPNAVIGTFYSHTLTATGGATPYAWAVPTGTLPGGLSLNASTGEISGTPTTPGANLFTIRVTDAASTTDTLAVSLQVDPNALGPVGWWRMEDGSGTTIQDVSGWANHGSVIADATWTTGLFGLGLQLDGSDDRALVPDAPTLDLTTGLTLATWIRPAQVADQCLMSKAMSSTTDGYELALSSAGRPFVRFNQASSGELFRVSGTQDHPSSGTTWMHLAATFDGSEIRLYVNGVLDSSKSAGLTVAANGLPLVFGAQGDGTRPYLGTLDEVKVFGRALSASEVSTLAVLPPVAVEPVAIPSLTQLARAMPNPFRNTTTLEYTLSVGGRVELSIFDLSGRRVRSLARGENPAGVHRVQWDGRDEVGNRLEAGVYFARLETPLGGFNKRIIRLN